MAFPSSSNANSQTATRHCFGQRAFGWVAFASLTLCLSGCSDNTAKKPLQNASHDVHFASQSFRVHWPPREPASAAYFDETPLLKGELFVGPSRQAKHDQFSVWVMLEREASEPARRRWNRELAFPEHDWMSRVRVWDADEKWLWPNLPFLLRANGAERIERYGGVDPGKGVDNDYAAVLIQPLHDSNFQVERPAVTAVWSAENDIQGNRQSIVHKAISQRLLISVNDQPTGSLGVWLIYADFLGADPPRSWPTEREDAGGILAWFSLDWRQDDAGYIAIEIQHATPPEPTGFDWAGWDGKS